MGEQGNAAWERALSKGVAHTLVARAGAHCRPSASGSHGWQHEHRRAERLGGPSDDERRCDALTFNAPSHRSIFSLSVPTSLYGCPQSKCKTRKLLLLLTNAAISEASKLVLPYAAAIPTTDTARKGPTALSPVLRARE